MFDIEAAWYDLVEFIWLRCHRHKNHMQVIKASFSIVRSVGQEQKIGRTHPL
jgi:hypothetical protein